MRDLTVFRVGGMADYYYEAKTVEDLVKAVKAAVTVKLPYFILGNGSNVLCSDYGFPGLVIKNLTSNIAIMHEKSQVIADSGMMLPKLIIEAVSNELSGLEFLYGVPGTVGGAAYGNAGAFGLAIGNYVISLTLLKIDSKNGLPKVVQVEAPWMDFEYRTTKLKKIKSKVKPVILTVRFQFSRIKKEELMRRLNRYQALRRKTQPVGFSAGSVFKNPIPESLKNVTGLGTKGMPEVPSERTAGFMLDKAGAKKIKHRNVEVSELHANWIIAKSGAKANEIRSVIEEMREKVRQKYNITLEEEVEYIGQW
jgi:UDP-N-acetylmuramate dehydrogenase